MNPVLSAIFRKTIALPTVSGYSFYTIAHILYFKADGKESVLFYLKNETGSEVVQITVFKGLKELETALSSCGFLRIRRDTLLNTLNIKTVHKDNSISLCTGETLHPSRDRVSTVNKYLKEYFYL